MGFFEICEREYSESSLVPGGGWQRSTLYVISWVDISRPRKSCATDISISSLLSGRGLHPWAVIMTRDWPIRDLSWARTLDSVLDLQNLVELSLVVAIQQCNTSRSMCVCVCIVLVISISSICISRFGDKYFSKSNHIIYKVWQSRLWL